LAGLRARQLEIRDIGGGNDQHERDGAQQHAQRSAHFRRAEHFAQVAALNLEIGPPRAFFSLAIRDYIQEGLHLGGFGAGTSFRNNFNDRIEIVRGRLGKSHRTPVFVTGSRKRKVRRNDAHDGHWSFAKGNSATNNSGIAAELALPESVTDHEHVVFARLTFVSGERASQQWPQVPKAEELRSHPHPLHRLWKFLTAKRQQVESVRGQTSEQVGLRKRVAQRGGIDALRPAPLLVHDSKLQEPLRMLRWQRIEHGGLDDAHNGGRGPDTEREREHGHGGEAGVLAQHPQTVAKVLNQVLNPIHSPLLAARLLDRLHPAELSECRVTRLLRVHASLNVLLRLHFDVRTHLLVHLRVELALLKQRAKSKIKFSPPVHGFPFESVVSSPWSVVRRASHIIHHDSRFNDSTVLSLHRSRRLQNQVDRGGKAFPIGGLFDELLATHRSQLVEFRLAVVLRGAPFRTDPSLLLQTIERRVQRALLYLQNVSRHLPDEHRDAEPVHWTQLKRLEDEHVQRAL